MHREAMTQARRSREMADRSLSQRVKDARLAHRLAGPRAGIAAYCAGNKWLEENARAVGNL